MLIEGRDYRIAADGAIELLWNGEWLTAYQIAYSEDVPNAGSTLHHRVARAVSGDPKYRKYSLKALIETPAHGKKAMLSDVYQCPRLAVLFIVWAAWVEAIGEPLYLRYWYSTMASGNCGGEGEALGVCASCYGARCKPTTNAERVARLSPEAKRAEKEREMTPERKRAKKLAKRKHDFLPSLLSMQADEPLSKEAVRFAAASRWDDFEDEEEFEVFAQRLYSNYASRWLKSTTHKNPLGALHATENQPLSRSEELSVAAYLESLPKRRRKSA